MTVGLGISFVINSSEETLGCESLRLNCVHSIEDQPLRFFRVTREEEMS